MKTRCKFKCNKISMTLHGSETLYTAEFNAVHGGSPENEAFFKWTPNGNLSVGVYTDDRFVVGKEYYLDITPCDEAAISTPE